MVISITNRIQENYKMIGKTVGHWFVLAGLFLVLGCGGGQYADVIKINHQFIAAMEDFSVAANGVENAKGAAAALNDMADTMEILMPKMKALSEKYPELQKQEELPEKLQALQDEAAAAGQKFSQSLMRLMPYMGNPDVQKAQIRVTEAMGQIGDK